MSFRILTISLLFLTLAGCHTSKSPEQEKSVKVGQLSIFMQQRYRREMDQDGFEINYLPQDDKILISVRCRPSSNRNLIGTLIDSAKEIIHRKGAELYKLEQVDVNVEIKEIDNKTSQ